MNHWKHQPRADRRPWLERHGRWLIALTFGFITGAALVAYLP